MLDNIIIVARPEDGLGGPGKHMGDTGMVRVQVLDEERAEAERNDRALPKVNYRAKYTEERAMPMKGPRLDIPGCSRDRPPVGEAR